MGKIVFDTYAIAAFFYDEKGAGEVENILKHAAKNGGRMMISAVNYGELFYAVLKKSGKDAALKARDMVDVLGIEVIDAGRELSLLAGSYKASNKMSFSDCFCAALAKLHGAVVITGDKEFKEVEREIKIHWI